jgi:hypothetical protein
VDDGRYAPDVELDLATVEREICRIPEVRAVRIVADHDGRPVEVHVLASPGKHAKQLARDVQSVAMASVGLDIDHRIISVVQLDDGSVTTTTVPVATDDGESPSPNGLSDAPEIDEPRILVDGVITERRGITCSAQVTLRRGDELAEGVTEGPAAASATARLVAEATLDALRHLEPAANMAHLETAMITRVGDREVAVTTVVLVIPPNEELMAGSAPVRGGDGHGAVARSVLDATNRRLAQLGR